MTKIPVIIDCDNTYGIDCCDVDDGLAILYLLGCRNVDLLAITCSFGNSRQKVVFDNTIRLMKDWQRTDIPVYEGCSEPGDYDTPASRFLSSKAAQLRGKIKLLCTGSVTNLYGAFIKDNGFYGNLRELSMMGGLTEPLFVGGIPMKELNFSCDSTASYETIRRASNIKIACASHCLESFFSRAELMDELDRRGGKLSDYLRSTLHYWYDINSSEWNLDGIVNWDVMAACQLIHPELFDMTEAYITPTSESLKSGNLISDGESVKVYLPSILDRDIYTAHIYDTYFSADVLGVDRA